MLGSLEELLHNANRKNQGLPCFNISNLDFLFSIITAAEEEDAPVIIALNHDMIHYYSLKILVPLLLAWAKKARVLVCPHFDHTYDPRIIKQILKLGLPSVMYDGSQLPIEKNIATMKGIGEITQK